MRRPGFAILVVCCAGLAGPSSGAVSPLERTRAVLEEARQIVDSAKTHNEKLADLSRLLKGFLDTDTMGREALGDHWSKFSPAQRQEFLQLFRELFQRTYVQKLLLFEKPDFGYVGEQVNGDRARVETKIITPRDEFAVIYQMRLDNGTWKATDIQIEDLSLTANFRRQLGRLLEKETPNDLLARMRRKYGPGGTGSEDEL
ncbi:MAG: ABC transporter substrate-binding protein [Candidatus Binatia bacterium]|nr:ABC transporter substrate-binding protein [Candidatus Binatia bacterium]